MKKVFRVFRIAVAILLIVVLFSEISSCAIAVFGPQSDDVVATVGEVVSVRSNWFGIANNNGYERWACHYVYVRPVGRGNMEELILFTVNCDTDMVSEFGEDRSSIPELQVGAVVEITHPNEVVRSGDRHPDDEKIHYVRGYEALSLKLYEGKYKARQSVLQKNPDFWWGAGMNLFPGYYGSYNPFIVSYVAKVTSPMRGYLVYGYEDHGLFFSEQVIWIGAGVFLNSATRRVLNSGAVGYTLWVNTEHYYPFKNLSAVQCVRASVSVDDDFYDGLRGGLKYSVYSIDEFIGTKTILVRSIKYEAYNRYYYIKLDTGELKALYKSDSKEEYTEFCSASAVEPKSGMFSDGVFPGEVYIALESLGDKAVSGELVISLCPIEETDYFRKHSK